MSIINCSRTTSIDDSQSLHKPVCWRGRLKTRDWKTRDQ